MEELSWNECKALARQIIKSKAPGVQEFLERLGNTRLGPSAISTLKNMINKINPGAMFMVDPQIMIRKIPGYSDMNRDWD